MARPGEVSSANCTAGLSGKKTMFCNRKGAFEQLQSDCTELTCPTDTGWPSTKIGTIHKMACDAGWLGEKWRQCLIDGTWSPVYEENCFPEYCISDDGTPCTGDPAPTYCAPDGDFPWTLAGTSAIIPCDDDSEGIKSRLCTNVGEWTDVIINCEVKKCENGMMHGEVLKLECAENQRSDGFIIQECINGQLIRTPNCFPDICQSDGVFPWAEAGTDAVASCGYGYTGNQSRSCLSNGEWAEVAQDDCVSLSGCPAVDGFSSLRPGEISVESCPDGYTNSVLRTCIANNSQSSASTNLVACEPVWCTGEGFWPWAIAGTEVEIPCEVGFVGNMRRSCGLDGEWESGSLDVSTCEEVLCTGDEGWPLCPCPEVSEYWPEALAGETVEAPCPETLTGLVTRRCGVKGQWEDPVFAECHSITCQNEEHGWESFPGENLTVPCPTGYLGDTVIHCVYSDETHNVEYSDQKYGCVEIICEYEGKKINIGESVEVVCPVENDITAKFICSEDGILVEDGSCEIKKCRNVELGFLLDVLVGETTTQKCPNGQVGYMSAKCVSDGGLVPSFTDIDVSGCQDILCTFDGLVFEIGEHYSQLCANNTGITWRVCVEEDGVGNMVLEGELCQEDTVSSSLFSGIPLILWLGMGLLGSLLLVVCCVLLAYYATKNNRPKDPLHSQSAISGGADNRRDRSLEDGLLGNYDPHSGTEETSLLDQRTSTETLSSEEIV